MSGQQTPDGGTFLKFSNLKGSWAQTSILGVHGVSKPIKKPWCVSSCDKRILKALAEYQCDGSHEHEPAEGSQTKQTGFYTEKFVSVILESWYPQKWFTNVPDLSSVSTLVRNGQKEPVKDSVVEREKEALGLRLNGTWDDTTVIPCHSSSPVETPSAKDR